MIELDAADHAHLERSLRIKAGSEITVADGTGQWRTASFGSTVEPTGEIAGSPRPEPLLTVAFTPVKGDRSDLVVQKLTELGVDVIVPLVTERSVVRWDDGRAAKNLNRHRKIAREAAMQSRNLWLPTVERVTDLQSFLTSRPATALADPSGTNAVHSATTIAIGPEGGFAPAELGGQPTVLLPGRILRTETAAIAAGVLLAAARGAETV